MFLSQMLLSQTSKERRLYIFTFVNQGLKLNHFATRLIFYNTRNVSFCRWIESAMHLFFTLDFLCFVCPNKFQ